VRTAPDHVRKRIQAREPEATVRWHERLHGWQLFWRDRCVCSLRHRDGSPMRGEIAVEEVLEILHSSDNRRDGPERLREIERNWREYDARAEAEEERLAEEAERHGADVAETVWRGGPKPFIHIIDNPLHATGAEQ
jgi:hypothetical protein